MKKIMFNDLHGLTEAVLSGRKTQTRWIVKGDVPLGNWSETYEHAKYKVGEVVAVAQSYKNMGMDATALDRPPIYVSHIRCVLGDSAGWNNKMFVRADACKNQIRITNVRVERLNEISDADCIKEGVELNNRQFEYNGQKFYCVRGLGHWRGIGCDNFNTAREAYAALIDRISGKGTWESNPYVFVYDFELVK